MFKKKIHVRILMLTILALSLYFGLTVSVGIAQQRPFEGKTITIACFAGGPKGMISGVLYQAKEEWEKATGAKLEIAEIPYGSLYEKVFTDLRAGVGAYDGILGQAWFMGDYLAGDYIVPINQYIGNPDFPRWNPDDIIPAYKRLLRWGENWYAPPFDCDVFTLWYRKDILDKHGFTAPKTIDELIEMSEFFNGKDWNEDGKLDYGISIFLKKGVMGSYFYTMCISAPYAILPGSKVDKYHNVYWFDPETMEPLINQPGHLRGVEKLVELVNKGAPRATLGWDLGESWAAFLQGKAVFGINTANLSSEPQIPGRAAPELQGNIGGSVIPGSYEVWDRENQEWIVFEEPNTVGNLHGANWAGVISKYSKEPETVYHFFSFLAQPERLLIAALEGWTGVEPTATYMFLPPYGTASIEEYVELGWNEEDAKEYSNTLYENFKKVDTYIHHLRIRGANEYFSVLDTFVGEALAGELEPREALDRVYQEWEKITERRGREELLREYQISIGYGFTPTGP